MPFIAFVITAAIFSFSVFSTGCVAYFNEMGNYFLSGLFGIEAVIMGALTVRMVNTLLDHYMPDTADHTQQ